MYRKCGYSITTVNFEPIIFGCSFINMSPGKSSIYPSEQYNGMKDFTSLSCWNKASQLKRFVYNEVVPLLPEEESSNLVIQLKRTAISCTANIAEGYGRYHYQESIQFFRIARASLYELKDHLISCYDLNFINKSLYHSGLKLIESSKITLNGYINYIISKKQSK